MATVTVTKTQDNPDGTTTNFLSDGSKSVVNYTKNADGSLQPVENAQASLQANANVPAGQAGSPWTLPSTTASNLINPPKQVQLPAPTVATTPSQFVQNLQPLVDQSNTYGQGLITANTAESAARNDVLTKLLSQSTPNSQGIYDEAFSKAGGDNFLKQFTDANTKLTALQSKFRTAGQNVSSASGQSQTFEGVQLGELSRQSAVEVGNQALVVQAMQGNLDTARQIAMDTTQFATQDRQAELQNLMAQYNALDGIVQGQEAQLIDQAKTKAQHEYEQLNKMQDTINSAISSGGATVDEMQQLSNLNATPEERTSLAEQIIARTSGENRAFDQNDKLFQQQLAEAGLSLQQQKLAFDMLPQGFKLGPNETQYDAQGNPIAGAGVNAGVPDPASQAQAQGNINLITGLLTDKGLNSAVGPNYLARFSVKNQLTGAKSNFIAGVVQLTGQLTLDNLIRAKANGATFGALSEGELNILASSASKLNSWAIKDKDGNVTGYNTSEGNFRAELDKINNMAKLDYVLKGGNVNDVGVQQMHDGSLWTKSYDGKLTQIIDKLPATAGSQKNTYGPASPFDSAGNASASNGNQVKGWSGSAAKLPLLNTDGNPKTPNIPLIQAYPPGSIGGQCGDFVRSVLLKQGLTYPTLGDSLQSKIAAVKANGVPLGAAHLGSVIVTKENPTYGHVATIIGANQQGFIVAESNYAAPNKVSYGRVIPYTSGSIVGVINPHPIG